MFVLSVLVYTYLYVSLYHTSQNPQEVESLNNDIIRSNPRLDHLTHEPLHAPLSPKHTDAADHHPAQDTGVLCPHPHAPAEEPAPAPPVQEAPVESLRFSGEALIREAVAAAMKQDAHAEAEHPALVDRLAERKIEATAVQSVMNQLEQTETNRPFANANYNGRAEPVMGRDEFVVRRPIDATGEWAARTNQYGERMTNALKGAGRTQSLAHILKRMLYNDFICSKHTRALTSENF